MMRRLFLLTALCLGTAVAAPSPDAARASSVEITSGQLRYLADKPEDGSEVNHVNIWLDGDLIYVQDTAGIDDKLSNACWYDDTPARVYCWAPAVSSLKVSTGGGNDYVAVSETISLSASVYGGGGKDTIYGGAGNDNLEGGDPTQYEWGPIAGDDTIYGRGGNDFLRGIWGTNILHGGKGSDTLWNENGDEVLYGDEGDDTLKSFFDQCPLESSSKNGTLSGGTGIDTVAYTARASGTCGSTDGVVVTLDGYFNDGAPAEKDNVKTDVETVQGSAKNDVLYGNDAANTLNGGAGDDYLDAGGGDDVVQGGSGQDLLRGGYGADWILGGSMVNGCCEFDTASWAGRPNPVTVSIDGLKNDGETGEGDYVSYDVENLTGGNGGDYLTGRISAGNVLWGGQGNDILDGKGGGTTDGVFIADALDGGSGDDTLVGGPSGSAYDHIAGGSGADAVTYVRTDGVKMFLDGSSSPGEDEIENDVENAYGGSGNDVLVGNASKNYLSGNGGDDTLEGFGEIDTLNGGLDQDTLSGGEASDVLFGGAGNDTLRGGPGGDSLGGSSGVDLADYSGTATPLIVTIDNLAGDGAAGEGDNVLKDVEDVTGGSGGDTITGSSAANVLTGGGGPDTLSGGDSGDLLIGGTENDQLHGDGGDDALRGGLGSDGLDGGADVDAVDYAAATAAINANLETGNVSGEGGDTLTAVENLIGSIHADTITGDNGPNALAGNNGTDTIHGGGGKDFLNGADGDDVLRGEGGDDFIEGGDGKDTAQYSTASGGVTVDLSNPLGTATGQGSDQLVNVENLDGSGFGDSLTGSSVANILNGLGGPDQLYGLAGKDTLNGGSGTDTLDGGADADSCMNGETLISC
jgi:Ca2+-binding RTX toxin-like protein